MRYSDLEEKETCKKCGVEFIKNDRKQLYCSKECRYNYNNGRGTMEK
jgi:uncharacterized Zn ribbon protein